MATNHASPQSEITPSPARAKAGRRRTDILPLYALAACLIIASTSWFLLKELAPLLRPLVLAVFLAYVVIPIHHALRRRESGASGVVMVAGILGLLGGLVMMIYANLVDLNADLPRLIERMRSVLGEVRAYGRTHLPKGLLDSHPSSGDAEQQGWDSIRASVRALLTTSTGMLSEMLVVGVYLVFLLLEVRHFPHRIRAGFEPGRADVILEVIARINAATVGYLRAKTVSSLAAAIPSALVLWAFGVRYPAMWGVLVFFGNFVPYVGSLVAVAFPVLLAFLDLQPIWRPCAVTLALILIQAVTGNVVEPFLTGKAVDLSPLATLLSLAFWGLCWGLTGMLLAVPLTAMIKIVAENMAYTRPLAALLAEGDGST